MTDVDFNNATVSDVFLPENFTHVIGMMVRHNGQKIGAKCTVSEDQYRRMQTAPEEKEMILDMLRDEIRRFASRLPPEPIRRLRATWTMEAAQDLRAMHGLNTDMLMEELARDMGLSRRWYGEADRVNWKKEGF